jgi:hypothetical protein
MTTRTVREKNDRIATLEASLYLKEKYIGHANARVEALETALEDKTEALHKIESWSRAYPLNIFPEPDWRKATELLEAGGITMDAVSAHCMRHVVEGVGKIARAALEPEK